MQERTNCRLLKALGFFLIFLLSSPCLICAVGADSSAPNWLKKDTYVKYTTSEVGYAYIFNGSNSRGYDTLSFWNATFGWRCVSLNTTMAKLNFTLHYVGNWLNGVSLENASLQISGDVDVDLYSRTVYASNGSLIGTTHLWGPANPSDGEDVVLWDIPPDRITLPASTNNIWMQTIQGKQDGYQVGGNGTVKGVIINFLILCDLDTELMVDGDFGYDPVMAGAGINTLLLNGRIILSDTNIQLGGPKDEPVNWSAVLTFLVLPVAVFAMLFVTLYIHYFRKKR